MTVISLDNEEVEVTLVVHDNMWQPRPTQTIDDERIIVDENEDVYIEE